MSHMENSINYSVLPHKVVNNALVYKVFKIVTGTV